MFTLVLAVLVRTNFISVEEEVLKYFSQERAMGWREYRSKHKLSHPKLKTQKYRITVDALQYLEGILDGKSSWF